MFCSNCGAKVLEGGNFCFNCGKPVLAPPTLPASSGIIPPFGTLNKPAAPPTPSNYPYPLPPAQSPPPVIQSRPNYPPPQNFIYPPPPNFSAPPLSPNFGYPPPPSGFPGWPSSPVYFPPPSHGPPGHTLLTGATWLPELIWSKPNHFYSFLDRNGKVKVARRVGFWLRAGAYLVDSLILLVPAVLLYLTYLLSITQPLSLISGNKLNPLLIPPAWETLLTTFAGQVYFFLLLGKTGKSLGKKVVKIKVIRLDGQKPDWLTAGLRVFLGATLSGAVVSLGYLWAGWDSQKQAWHDKLARTLVVDEKVLEEGRDFYLPGALPASSPG